MKFKKLAALLLCGATLFGAAACGGKKNNNSGEKLPDWAKRANIGRECKRRKALSGPILIGRGLILNRS